MKLVLVCAGGVASDVIGVVDAINQAGRQKIDIVGYVSDEQGDSWRFPWLNRIGCISDMSCLDHHHYVMCLGYPKKKKSVLARVLGRPAPALIHPRAFIPHGTQIGEGSVIMAGVCLSRGVSVGKHVYLSHGVLVGHETVIEDYVSAMPGASISGDVRLNKGSMIGANATVLERLMVGEWATVGAGAVVTKDVPNWVVVKGVPAK